MTTSIRTALTVIGRQLDADYAPILEMPVPRELEDLLAQLVAYENRKRESSGQSTMPQFERQLS